MGIKTLEFFKVWNFLIGTDAGRGIWDCRGQLRCLEITENSCGSVCFVVCLNQVLWAKMWMKSFARVKMGMMVASQTTINFLVCLLWFTGRMARQDLSSSDAL